MKSGLDVRPLFLLDDLLKYWTTKTLPFSSRFFLSSSAFRFASSSFCLAIFSNLALKFPAFLAGTSGRVLYLEITKYSNDFEYFNYRFFTIFSLNEQSLFWINIGQETMLCRSSFIREKKLLEPSCCKKRQKKSQQRNWFGECLKVLIDTKLVIND